ncbi:MAG: hypothetical protein U0996_24905 [Planctomycetaceae bacterium]
MAGPEELLSAGALVSLDQTLSKEQTADTVSARSYRHPALGDRVVVRLAADNLAVGDDLTMEFLGFEAPEVNGPLARRQRQALGFPSWAIINDPKHARYALELVKEFKKAVRRSKAKPGHGYDSFVEIAKRLGKSVAHFLPSFWEQVGREFIALDNATYASRAFGKAREAEKVHALKVDETLRKEAFLEFALAGAVSIKALTEYGRDLAAALEPSEAWMFFRELCIRRTLGGMPPWTSMIKDITPLIKAAKLDVVEETQKIIVDLVESPAISRASFAFWESVSKAMIPLVAGNAHVAGVLLNLIPQTSAWKSEHCRWLEILNGWGILQNAWKGDVATEAGPVGGTAAWLNRVLQQGGELTQVLFDAVGQMQEKLRHEAVPVAPYYKARWGNRWFVDVDLLDYLLELKISVADPPPELEIPLNEWARLKEKAAKNRPRDPMHLVADSRFAKAFHVALQGVIGDATFEAIAAGKSAMREARREWLLRQIRGVSAFGLPDSETFLDLLESKTTRAIFQEFPEAMPELEKASIVVPLMRTLQTGLMDEYGWPLLESVFEEFKAAGVMAPMVFGQFPYVIVTDRLKAVVLRGNEIVHRAELKIAAGDKLKQLMFIDGDLVVWAGGNYQVSCFWNSDPQPMEGGYLYWDAGIRGVIGDLPDGGSIVGTKIVHRNEKTPPPSEIDYGLRGDGKHWWKESWEYNQSTSRSSLQLQELDPRTGQLGRKSLPSWFEDFLTEGATLELGSSSLLPVKSGFAKSPLGIQNGLVGFRVRSQSGVVRIEGIDGRAVESKSTRNYSLLLSQPGSSQFLPIQMETEYRGWKLFRICDPTGEFTGSEVRTGIGAYNRGQVFSVPPIFLHAFEVRDAAASKKLRAITESDVRELLLAENRDVEYFRANGSQAKSTSVIDKIRGDSTLTRAARTISENDDFKQLDSAIEKLLGPNSDRKLRIGLRGVVIRAGNKERAIATLITRRKEAPADTIVANVHEADSSIEHFIRKINHGFRAIPGRSFVEAVNELGQFLNGTRDLVLFPGPWFSILPNLVNCIAERTWALFCDNPADLCWRPFAELWIKSPMGSLTGRFRRYSGNSTSGDFLSRQIAAVETQTNLVSATGYATNVCIPVSEQKNRYLVFKTPTQYDVLEYSPDGQFRTLEGLAILPTTVQEYPEFVWKADRWASFLRCTGDSGLALPSPDFFATLSKELHASAAEVAIVWFGLPNVDSYQTHFMPVHLRDSCKLKAKECSAARESLKALSTSRRYELVRSLIDGDPAELWEDPPTQAAERLSRVWLNDKQRLPLSAEWIEKLCDAFEYGQNKNRVLQAMNVPTEDPLFHVAARWTVRQRAGAYYREILPEDINIEYFDSMTLRGSVIGILMLNYGLPVGDPARQKMPALHQQLLKALGSRDLVLHLGSTHLFNEKDPDHTSKVVESLVAKPTQQEKVLTADDGNLWVILEGYQVYMGFRPGKIMNQAAWTKIDGQVQGLQQDRLGNLPQFEGYSSVVIFRQIQIARSEGMAAIIQRIQNTPVPPGEWECNPLHSAPATVAAAAKKLKVSEAAATYYLQVLTLPDPTDKNIQAWNHWTSSAQKAAGKELIEKRLLIEASRSRAGRKLFLPGGWEDLKAPHLPLETWKLPLFQMTREPGGRAVPPLSRIIPLEPVHLLFERAWKRIASGDLPKYEEVR